MIRRPPRSTLSSSSAASDVYKRQVVHWSCPKLLKHFVPKPDHHHGQESKQKSMALSRLLPFLLVFIFFCLIQLVCGLVIALSRIIRPAVARRVVHLQGLG
eukprot:TRINITY_DN8253_c0_g2_i2.p2 TRINITY_DN8253_c0_g2~~TRINITY_DN8253_c0_g2_i2.p2  ORF type:complete len:101 (+),score=14.91 TRINITY_DN8253_c0_g2_i2:120-422(+)